MPTRPEEADAHDTADAGGRTRNRYPERRPGGGGARGLSRLAEGGASAYIHELERRLVRICPSPHSERCATVPCRRRWRSGRLMVQRAIRSAAVWYLYFPQAVDAEEDRSATGHPADARVRLGALGALARRDRGPHPKGDAARLPPHAGRRAQPSDPPSLHREYQNFVEWHLYGTPRGKKSPSRRRTAPGGREEEARGRAVEEARRPRPGVPLRLREDDLARAQRSPPSATRRPTSRAWRCSATGAGTSSSRRHTRSPPSRSCRTTCTTARPASSACCPGTSRTSTRPRGSSGTASSTCRR